jgi:hypothetical protein
MKRLEEILMAGILYNHKRAKKAKKWPTPANKPANK